MNTYTYLSQVERCDRLIQNKLSEIFQLKAMASSVSIQPKDINVQVSGDKDKLGSTVAKIVDMERKVDELIDRYVDEKAKIISQIEGLENTNEYHVLYSRFVTKKTYDQIGAEINYSRMQVTRIEKSAMAHFEEKYGKTYLKRKK